VSPSTALFCQIGPLKDSCFCFCPGVPSFLVLRSLLRRNPSHYRPCCQDLYPTRSFVFLVFFRQDPLVPSPSQKAFPLFFSAPFFFKVSKVSCLSIFRSHPPYTFVSPVAPSTLLLPLAKPRSLPQLGSGEIRIFASFFV